MLPPLVQLHMRLVHLDPESWLPEGFKAWKSCTHYSIWSLRSKSSVWQSSSCSCWEDFALSEELSETISCAYLVKIGVLSGLALCSEDSPLTEELRETISCAFLVNIGVLSGFALFSTWGLSSLPGLSWSCRCLERSCKEDWSKTSNSW